jgi:hypothetical protein
MDMVMSVRPVETVFNSFRLCNRFVRSLRAPNSTFSSLTCRVRGRACVSKLHRWRANDPQHKSLLMR